MAETVGHLDQNVGHLAQNVMHFARILRRAGLPVGSGQIVDALRALAHIDLGRREEFYWALAAVLVTDHHHHELFDEAFRLFWRDPDGMSTALAMFLPRLEVPGHKPKTSRRVAEALRPNRPRPRQGPREQQEIEFDAALSFSAEERLRHKDFAEMSAEELARAKQLIRRLRLPVRDLPTRRFGPDPRGAKIDLRATFRAAARTGSDLMPLRRRSPRTRPPTLVALCDISGSMERYAEILLHFLHALTSARDRVHSFVFGTRLTNVTRHLRRRDIDRALADIGQKVEDWAGGTRIGVCIDRFNRDWSRRVLGQGAVVVLITDGLDREDGHGLDAAMERLHKSCRRLIWLNPLLRYAGFEPRARGIRAMLPHVDDFRPVHDLDSLATLAAALGTQHATPRRRPAALGRP
ncbi:vWA domain-containing protein [Haliangium sp.]|uniref:vWA domain-containing protein n=1 Tax=Haliangium sp. TaxID=2663208 RepID=UPI003D11E4F7